MRRRKKIKILKYGKTVHKENSNDEYYLMMHGDPAWAIPGEECRGDILRSQREGMETGSGYIFATSNCVYTGMALKRYEMMMDLWKKYGNYDHRK